MLLDLCFKLNRFTNFSILILVVVLYKEQKCIASYQASEKCLGNILVDLIKIYKASKISKLVGVQI